MFGTKRFRIFHRKIFTNFAQNNKGSVCNYVRNNTER